MLVVFIDMDISFVVLVVRVIYNFINFLNLIDFVVIRE